MRRRLRLSRGLGKADGDGRPLHNSFPLQGVMSHSSSADLRVEFKEVHAAAPTGSWARLAHMLTSLSELYIIFERVCCLVKSQD